MKVVVIGGTGLIGSKVVERLRQQGHKALAAAPNSGVDTITGEGLDDALHGAHVVVDVSNSPSLEERAALNFFETSTRHLLAAEAKAGVTHHVALSIVGTERLAETGYFRAKLTQEELIKGGTIPYSIVHATQFFEFVKGIANAAADGDTVRMSPAHIQPMAADDVARAVADVAVGAPLNGTLEIAGPDVFSLDEFVRLGLKANGDPRTVIADPQARYFGAILGDGTLTPGEGAHLGKVHFEEWLESAVPLR